MKVSALEFTWSETRQPKPYESVAASLKVTVCLDDNDDASKVSESVIARTKAKVKAAIAAEINAGKEESTIC
jgi:hypothetical protein